MREEVKKIINHIAYDILDNMVSPICGISDIFADIFMADIDVYTMGDERENDLILKAICEKYGVDSMVEDEFVAPFEAHDSLAQIALYVYFYGDKFNEM